VQVREEHLTAAHAVVLLLDRFLDLEDQVALGPDVVRVRQDRGPGGGELVIGDRGTEAGAGLDEHLVTVADELVHARRRDRHPVLVVLDLAGDAYLHRHTSSSPRRVAPLPPCAPRTAFGPSLDPSSQEYPHAPRQT
jgi:hypothetical protein